MARGDDGEVDTSNDGGEWQFSELCVRLLEGACAPCGCAWAQGVVAAYRKHFPDLFALLESDPKGTQYNAEGARVRCAALAVAQHAYADMPSFGKVAAAMADQAALEPGLLAREKSLLRVSARRRGELLRAHSRARARADSGS